MIQRKGVGLLLLMALVLCLCSAGYAVGEPRPTEKVDPPPEVTPNAVVWRTPEPPVNPEAGDVWVNPKDGMEMVYVAPGEFTLGTSDVQIDAWLKEHPGDKREWFKDEQPQCRVRLPGYWMGRTEVTNAQYLRFVQATGHRAPYHWKGGQVPSGLDSLPVVQVNWQDARAYCEWAGGRLPTELEWEKAARGGNGRIFPWGNEYDTRRCRNFEAITGRTYESEWLRRQSDRVLYYDPVREGPAAAGSYGLGASPYGCLDMAGNVWEWCADWYDENAYKRYAKGDLTPPKSGTYKVLRGGSWYCDSPSYFRCADRYFDAPPDYYRSSFYFGFRCARDASP
jgi:iron(II)-dependent oxidoreductase